MIAGQLEIQINADIEKLAEDMREAKRATGEAMNDIGTKIGAGFAAGWEKAKKAWEAFRDWMERQIVIWGIALAIGISAAVLGAVYAAFRGISFAIGLLTGTSYKSANIDALAATNREVKTLQEILPLTAVGASALNEALKVQGTNASEYAETINRVSTSIHTNTEELDRLGVKYGSTDEALKSAAAVLATYKAGWDRNQAAQAIGMGTEKQIHDALAITAAKLETAKDSLISYGLVIGDGTQKAVAEYEQSMREFQRETDLTGEGFKRAIADNIMPLLTDLADFFKGGFPIAVQAFRYSIAIITSLFYGLKTVVFIITESIVGAFDAIEIGLTKGWKAAKERLNQIGTNIEEQARRNRAAMLLAFGADSLTAGEAPSGSPSGGKTWVGNPKDQAEIRRYIEALQSLEKQIFSLNNEGAVSIAVYETTRGSLRALTDEHKREIIVKAQEFDTLKRTIDMRKMVWTGIEAEGAARTRSIQSIQDYVAANREFNQQQEFEISLIGKSSIEKERANALRKIDLDLRQRVASLPMDSEGNMLPGSSSALDALRMQAEMQKKLVLENMQTGRDATRDWSTGTRQAFNDYIDHASNAAEQASMLFGNAFRNMEDALVRFAMTGKFEFSSFANSVIADLIRIQIRSAAAGFFGNAGLASLFSGNSGGTTAPTGGGAVGDFPVSAPVAHGGGVIGVDSFPMRTVPASIFTGAPRYHSGLALDERVGIFQTGERVIPRGGSAGPSISQVIHVGGNVTQADIPMILAAARQGTLQALADEKRRNPSGPL